MKDTTMKQIFIEFVIPDTVYKNYEEIIQEFTEKVSSLHGLTFDSFQVREFELDEIPF